MSIKEKIMDTMMGKFFNSMTKEDKQNMMQGMMDKFFAGMSPEERKEMMSGMMPKMMAGMMGGRGFNMMDMMKNMMGGKKEGEDKNGGPRGFNPMEMCHKMMTSMGKSSELASDANPEVRALFEEWSEQIENEIFNFIKETGTAQPDRLAEQFKLSKDSVNFFLTRLAQKNKIKLKAEKA